jgi:hypothetical protein
MILLENKYIRRMHILIEGYDNNYALIDYIRANRWIKEMQLDVQFHDLHCVRNENGYHPPTDEEGVTIPSISRIESLVLYHGVKSERARNEYLASFPPQLMGELVCLKELTILSFLDDELFSK